MSKERVYQLLRERPEGFLSGEELSRLAVGHSHGPVGRARQGLPLQVGVGGVNHLLGSGRRSSGPMTWC